MRSAPNESMPMSRSRSISFGTTLLALLVLVVALSAAALPVIVSGASPTVPSSPDFPGHGTALPVPVSTTSTDSVPTARDAASIGDADAADPTAANSSYAVVFTESGLPSGSIWELNVTGTGPAYSTVSTITVTLPDGVYSFTTDTSKTHYTPVEAGGSFTVAGSSLSESTAFWFAYPVTFVELGLPSPPHLAVTFNGVSRTSLCGGLEYYAGNGSWSYSVGSASGFGSNPANGTVVVRGAPQVITLSFSAVYAVIYNWTGLAPHTNWSVTMTGGNASVVLVRPLDAPTVAMTRWSDGAASIRFYLSNGTYTYTAGAPGHSNVSGVQTVDGATPPAISVAQAASAPAASGSMDPFLLLFVIGTAAAVGSVSLYGYRTRWGRPSRSEPSAISEADEPALPTRFSQWVVVARGQILNYARTNRFLGLLVFVAVVSSLWLGLLIAAGHGIAQLSFLDSVSEFTADYAATVPLWIILAAAFFGGDALSVDFHSPTGYYTLVLPVGRGTLLAGRYASALAVTIAITFAYVLFGLLGASYAFGPGSIPWNQEAVSLGLAVLFALAAVSVAFCFSALFKSPAAGVLLTIMVLFVGMTTVQGIAQIAGFEPWWSLNWAGGAIGNVLDWQFVAHQTVPVGGGQSIQSWSATATQGAEIMVAYFLVFLGLTWVLYNRKESRS
jgi:ABC-type transport system involved in multi-copper enzyme maturation permease subunit